MLVSANSKLKKLMLSAPSKRGPACQVAWCSLAKEPWGICGHSNMKSQVYDHHSLRVCSAAAVESKHD